MVKEGKKLVFFGLILLIFVLTSSFAYVEADCETICSDYCASFGYWDCVSDNCRSDACYCQCHWGVLEGCHMNTYRECPILSYCVGNDIGILHICSYSAQDKCSGQRITQTCTTNSACTTIEGGPRCDCLFGRTDPLQPHWDDCDRNFNNGCEANLAQNTMCGGFGPRNPGGGGNCNYRSCNSHESCKCTHYTGMETTWTCGCECDVDWGNCDNNQNNGCETFLRNNNQYCGACYNNCSTRGVDWVCVGTSCLQIPLISSLSIVPNCVAGQDNCDLLDEINLTTVFFGNTRAIRQLRINLTSADGSCKPTMSVADCNLSNGALQCMNKSKILFVQPECAGQVVYPINVSSYDSLNNLLAYNDSEYVLHGEFRFSDPLSQFLLLDALPDGRNVTRGSVFPLQLFAYFNKGGEISSRDVTYDSFAHYQSNNPGIIRNNQNSLIAIGVGTANITSSYPYGYSPLLTDQSSFRVWTNTDCQISSAYIEPKCGNDGLCDPFNQPFENITLGLTTVNCLKYLNQGGKIIMIAENITYNKRCIVYLEGELASRPSSAGFGSPWIITLNNVDWQNCLGSNVYVRYAGLWNKTGSNYALISNKISQSPEDFFGNFTFIGSLIPPTCSITNANIVTYCNGTDGACNISNKITLNISVEELSKCIRVNKLEMNATEIQLEGQAKQNPCKVSLRNSTYIRQVLIGSGPGGYLYSNWTIDSIASNCNGVNMNVSKAALYNGTGSINKIGEKIGDFGAFTFEGLPPIHYSCVITNANIIPYCGSDGCNDTIDKIGINITVSNPLFCVGVDKIEINATNSTLPYCNVLLENSSDLINPVGRSYVGNWTVTVPSHCDGYWMNASYASLYNGTSHDNQIGEMNGSFGTFNFAGIPAPYMFNLSVDTCGVDANGQCENFTINGTVSVNGSNWGNTPKSNLVQTGWENLSFGSIPPGEGQPWYKPADFLVDMVRDFNYTGMYTKSQFSNATIIVFARDVNGNFINAQIRIWNESGIAMSGFNRTEYVYDGSSGWYKVFTIEFRYVSSRYTTPDNITFIVTGPGLNVFDRTYQYNQQTCFCNDGTPCNSCKGTTGYFCEQDPQNPTQGRFIPACNSPHQCSCGTLTCNQTSGYCQGNQATCHAQNRNTSATCQAGNGCFWDLGRDPLLNGFYCEACHAVNNIPVFCGDYKNATACQKPGTMVDACGIGVRCPGAPSGAFNCKCVWQSNACQLSFNISSGGGGGGGGSMESCILNLNVGECGAAECGTNKKLMIYNYTAPLGATCSLPNSTSCVRCGVTTERMPFFAPWQITIVLLLLAVYYTFMLRKHKK